MSITIFLKVKHFRGVLVTALEEKVCSPIQSKSGGLLNRERYVPGGVYDKGSFATD
jgi:hypothetical protein